MELKLLLKVANGRGRLRISFLFFLPLFAQWFGKKRNRQLESSFLAKFVVFLLVKVSVASFTFFGVFVSSAMRHISVNYHYSSSQVYVTISPLTSTFGSVRLPTGIACSNRIKRSGS